MSNNNNIAKNTSYFTLALIMQKLISFSYFTILARNLPPEQLGKYYFAISFTTIFAIFIDLGLANVLTREVARLCQSFGGQAKTKERAQNLLGSALAIKIPLALASLSAVFILVNALGYPSLTKTLVYISSISMVFDSFALIFYACLRGFHNLKFESFGVIAYQLIVFILGLTALKLGLGLIWLIAAAATASAVAFLYSAGIIRLKYKIKIKPVFNYALIKIIVSITIPFALFGIFQRLYMYLDTVLLSKLAGDAAVGLYQIAFKIIFALQFLPMAFMASLYPAFASYWGKQKETKSLRFANANRSDLVSSLPSQLVISFERAMNYLIIISLPISIGIITLADKIILIFKSDYTAAILPLQVIMAALLFIFINFPIGALLNACDKQAVNTRNMGLALAASVALNLILIPRFAAVGAAITVLATNFFMFILGIYYVPKIITVRPMKIISVFIKTLLSAATMAFIILMFKPFMNIFLIILLAAGIYFIVLFILGGYRKEDIQSLIVSFKK